MTDINTSNAIAQERARIREEVMEVCKTKAIMGATLRDAYIPLGEVLRIIGLEPTVVWGKQHEKL